MTSPEFGEPVAEAMAWKLISELARRHPARLWVRTETHSVGSEQAFLIDLQSPSAAPLGIIGLPGSAASSWGASERMEWRDAYDGQRDPRDWLAEFERLIGLAAPAAGLPASTPSSLALRVIGQLLVATIGARKPWIAGGPRRWASSDLLIPRTRTWVNDDALPYPFEPLFIGPRDAEVPVAALSPSGHLWMREGGAEFDLRAEYTAAGSSISMLLVSRFSEWLV